MIVKTVSLSGCEAKFWLLTSVSWVCLCFYFLSFDPEASHSETGRKRKMWGRGESCCWVKFYFKRSSLQVNLKIITSKSNNTITATLLTTNSINNYCTMFSDVNFITLFVDMKLSSTESYDWSTHSVRQQLEKEKTMNEDDVRVNLSFIILIIKHSSCSR